MTEEPVVGDTRPVLRIVSGNPTPEQVAAVTVVLTALAGGQDQPDQAPEVGGWSDLSLRLRRPLPPGPGAWRNSAWQ